MSIFSQARGGGGLLFNQTTCGIPSLVQGGDWLLVAVSCNAATTTTQLVFPAWLTVQSHVEIGTSPNVFKMSTAMGIYPGSGSFVVSGGSGSSNWRNVVLGIMDRTPGATLTLTSSATTGSGTSLSISGGTVTSRNPSVFAVAAVQYDNSVTTPCYPMFINAGGGALGTLGLEAYGSPTVPSYTAALPSSLNYAILTSIIESSAGDDGLDNYLPVTPESFAAADAQQGGGGLWLI